MKINIEWERERIPQIALKKISNIRKKRKLFFNFKNGSENKQLLLYSRMWIRLLQFASFPSSFQFSFLFLLLLLFPPLFPLSSLLLLLLSLSTPLSSFLLFFLCFTHALWIKINEEGWCRIGSIGEKKLKWKSSFWPFFFHSIHSLSYTFTYWCAIS